MKSQAIILGIIIALFSLYTIGANQIFVSNQSGTPRLSASPASLVASTPDPILALTREALPANLFRLLLPIDFAVKDPQQGTTENTILTIVDIQFIGAAEDWKASKLVAVVVPKAISTVGATNLLSASDRNIDLKVIRDRVLQSPSCPDWFAIMSIRGEWSPWHLTLTADRAEIGKRSGATKPPPAYVETAFRTPRQLPTIFDLNTSQINTPLDETHPLPVNVAISFAAGTMTFAFIPSAVASGWLPPPPGPLGITVDPTGAVPNSNLVAVIPHSFANFVITTVYKDSTLSLPSMGGTAATLGSLSLATTLADEVPPQHTVLRISGIVADSAGNPAFPMSMDWAGDDLKFSTFRVGDNICETAECKSLRLRAFLAVAFLNRTYRNRFLRPENARDVGQFILNGKQMTLNLLALGTKAGPSALFMSGVAIVDPR